MSVFLALVALTALAVIAIVIRLTRSVPPLSGVRSASSESEEQAAASPLPLQRGSLGIDASDDDVTEFTLAVTGNRPFLLLTVGTGAGSKHFLSATGTTTIGRSSSNDIVVKGTAASATHCRIEQKGATYVLTDLGSTNQTWVNGAAVEQAVLRNGDEIRIGDATMSFALFGSRT